MANPAFVTVTAPAKINLELRVGPLREDGFHQLATVYQAVEIYEELTVEDAAGLSVVTTGPYARADLNTADHLALRAAKALAEATGVEPRGAIRITKRIPVAGGMAGGSADAAAALRACSMLWKVRLNRQRLLKIAEELGSDVPFMLIGGTAIGTGRGQHVHPTPSITQSRWLVAIMRSGLSTPKVFHRFDELQAGDDKPRAPQVAVGLLMGLAAGDSWAVSAHLGNDLQEAAISLRPELGKLMELGEKFGATPLLSGSGPTLLFFLHPHTDTEGLQDALQESESVATVIETASTPSGVRVIDQSGLDS